MVRLLIGAAGGTIVGFMLATAVMAGHADTVAAEVLEAAVAAHVDPILLQGAVNSTGADPYDYLRGTGELPPLREPVTPPPRPAELKTPATPPASGRVACIIHGESRGDPHATNARSGAAGLGQFLPGTWRSTPQGRAGLSPYDPAANTAAIQWMIQNGRAGEFDAVRYGGC